MKNKNQFQLIFLILVFVILVLGEAAVWMLQWWPHSFEWLLHL